MPERSNRSVTRPQAFATLVGMLLIGLVVVALVVRVPHATISGGRDGRNVAPTATATPLLLATNRLSVALGGAGTPTRLALSTNEETWEDLAQPTTTRGQSVASALYGWNPPAVRLHFGFRADVPALPEATRGSWDFTHMDAAIGQLRAHGTAFFLNVRTAPLWMYDRNGQLSDSMFAVYAQYLARLVGWYNKGGFTDDAGVFHPSGHTSWIHTWEIWNEPKSGAEIPAPLPPTYAPPWMTAERFAALYDLCSAAMRAVDPLIIIGGPALGSWPYDTYLRDFMANVHAPVAFFSFHFYAAGSATETDADSLAAVTGDRFLKRLKEAHQILRDLRPGQDIPIWIDEVGFNEAAHAAVDPRGSTPICYAFISDTFATAEAQGVALLSQFELVSNEQLGLINYQTNQLQRPYWLYRILAKQFPAGATLYPVTIDRPDQLVAVAAVAPDGTSLNLLIGNITVAHPTDVNGAGVPKVVRIALNGLTRGKLSPTATVWRFDARTPITSAPTPDAVPLFAPAPGQSAIEVPVGGYGATVVSIPLMR